MGVFFFFICNPSDVGQARSSNDNDEETKTGSNGLPPDTQQFPVEESKEGRRKHEAEML